MPRCTGSIDADVVSANRLEPTIAVDTTETVAFANERFYDVAGLDPDATIGADLTVLERVIEAGFDGLQEAIRAVLAGDTDDVRVTLSMSHPADAPVPRRLPAEARITPIESGMTDPGALVSIRGTRTRKEYERRLERQNARLEEFADVVAHDLRNPLNVADGRLDLLSADGEHDAAHVDALGDALDRMRAIIDETLTLAKQGRHVGETEAVSLAEFVDQCWTTVETDGATLTVDDDVTILADSARLRHLFENLFRNSVEHGSTGSRSDSHGNSVEHGSTGNRTESVDAIEHGRAGTDGESVRVRVGVLRDNNDPVGFYVEDDGPGIPEDEREQVFELGYTTASDGTGYGLAIVTWIAEAHGWSVSVTDGTDGGARFEFTGVTFE